MARRNEVRTMASEPKRIKVGPGSELAHLLEQATVAPLILDKDGELFRVDHMQRERDDIWASYDTTRVREALKKSAGALAGVDREQLLADTRAQRAQDSKGRPAR
jgi:hypothetical protein